jgi:hypothetical protein
MSSAHRVSDVVNILWSATISEIEPKIRQVKSLGEHRALFNQKPGSVGENLGVLTMGLLQYAEHA